MEMKSNSENNSGHKSSFGFFMLIFVGFMVALIGLSLLVVRYM